jgi:hypothetical protein
MRNEDIQICDSCGRYLYLPDEEKQPTAEVKLVKTAKKGKTTSKAAEPAV